MRTCEECGDAYDVRFDAESFLKYGEHASEVWHFGSSNDYWDCLYHATERLYNVRERMCPACAANGH